MTLFSPSLHHFRCANNGRRTVVGSLSPAVNRCRTTPLSALLFLTAASWSFADSTVAPRPEAALLFRTGFDSNPTAMGGTTAAPNGGEDVFFYAAGFSAGYSLPTAKSAQRSLKVGYTGELTRFDDCPTENFATHRFGWSGQISDGTWKFTGEGSTLLIAGSRETLPSLSASNANAVSLWRDRRRQWQHRLKLQAQTTREKYLLRATGTLLAYDYLTRAVSGNVPFADRSDTQASVDLGWKQNPASTWFTGLKAGHQNQAIVPLPNCEFDYTNNYQRIVAGWEGKPSVNTTAAILVGPDFRHYSGAIDSRVFTGGRNRTSFWMEGSFSAKPCPALTLTGKAGRMDWLSSTGKSAYVDTNAEAAAAWTLTPAWTVRCSAKVHRCDYFPAIRDDWESMLGAGATLKVSAHTTLTLDYLYHTGWNGLANIPGREFQREVVNFGATISL